MQSILPFVSNCYLVCVLLLSGHYDDVTMSLMASQITSLTIVYSTVYSGADQRKLQSSASLAFVRGIHRGPVNSPHKRPVPRKMFPFDDVIMHRLALPMSFRITWLAMGNPMIVSTLVTQSCIISMVTDSHDSNTRSYTTRKRHKPQQFSGKSYRYTVASLFTGHVGVRCLVNIECAVNDIRNLIG